MLAPLVNRFLAGGHGAVAATVGLGELGASRLCAGCGTDQN